MNVIGIALDELYRIFSVLNHDKFDDALPEPVITIQKTKGRTLGHFTLDKVWRNKQRVEEVRLLLVLSIFLISTSISRSLKR